MSHPIPPLPCDGRTTVYYGSLPLSSSASVECCLMRGHEGSHIGYDRWGKEVTFEEMQCWSTFGFPGYRARCKLKYGHEGACADETDQNIYNWWETYEITPKGDVEPEMTAQEA